MISNKPYLIRAFYQWIVDSACAPYIVINANYPGCRVPLDYVEQGEITLNISPSAVRDMNMTNDLVEFRASFSGVVYIISVPVRAVLGIYANEHPEEQRIFFDYEDAPEGEEETTVYAKPTIVTASDDNKISTNKDKDKPYLRLVE